MKCLLVVLQFMFLRDVRVEAVVSAYPEIVFPLEAISNEMEAQKHFDWFMSIFDERIDVLTKFVNEETDSQWAPNFSIASLNTIDAWLLIHSRKKHVSSRERRKQIEKRKLHGLWSQLTMEWDEYLTRDTALRCFDVAIYFGETLRRNNSDLKWTFLTSPKDLVDVYIPVLIVPKNDMNLNPNRITAVIASKNADYLSSSVKTERRCELAAMYNVWSDIFTSNFDPYKNY